MAAIGVRRIRTGFVATRCVKAALWATNCEELIVEKFQMPVS
jgi:hypothetical protein